MSIFLKDKQPIGHLISRVSYWENVHWPRLLLALFGKPFLISLGLSIVLILLFDLRDWGLVAGILVFVHLIAQWCFCITILGHAWFSTNKLYFLSGKLTLKSMGVTYRIDSSSLHLSPGLLSNDVHMKYARPIPSVLLTTSYYGEQARFAIQIDHELGSHASSDRAWAYTIPWICSFVVFLITFVLMIHLFSLMPNQILGRAPMFAIGALSGSLAHLTWTLLLRRGQLLEMSDLENASESIGYFLMTRRAGYKPLIVITIAIIYGFNQPIACLVLIITFATSIYLFHLSKQVVLSESKTIQQFARRREIQAEKLTKQLAPKLLAELPVGIAS